MTLRSLMFASWALAGLCVLLIAALVLNFRIQGMSGAEAVYEHVARNHSPDFSKAQLDKISEGVRWSHANYSDIQNLERLLLWYSGGLLVMAAFFVALGVQLRKKN